MDEMTWLPITDNLSDEVTKINLVDWKTLSELRSSGTIGLEFDETRTQIHKKWKEILTDKALVRVRECYTGDLQHGMFYFEWMNIR